MEPFQLRNDLYMSIPLLEELNPSIVAGFSTKRGGISRGDFNSLNLGLHVGDEQQSVRNNRQVLSEAIEFPLSNWVCAQQTHQDHIEKVTVTDLQKGVFDEQSALSSTDGMYTNDKNLMLTLCFADCVPLFYYHPKKQLIGLIHAGWKGTAAKISRKIVSEWVMKEGASLNDIYVFIGPSIKGCCYIVDDRVITSVGKTVHAPAQQYAKEVTKGQYAIDLSKINKLQLVEEGVKEKNIFSSSLCTSCKSDLFFSHRRDGGKTGRMMSFIGYKEDI
ncbi:peptidoglycan editing factor PgeF [Bacillus carboniphilus]|uniref:Purine nucleoside phosphorylase n=1 Tax=Bacillus carboniphilus TaxID=86663 RepID=A0ABY9JW37_9BACI|nr:peptidoglycan editing factor PgeF [Bacillus carboniphilus]WLR43614.1 peptidoglycan editing factor PgeF [Bacillus carboniphilus]